jgi:hypothetical protein
LSRHRWLYIPDLANPTGWATHDADHPVESSPADAIGFHRIGPVDDVDDDDATDITMRNVDNFPPFERD